MYSQMSDRLEKIVEILSSQSSRGSSQLAEGNVQSPSSREELSVTASQNIDYTSEGDVEADSDNWEPGSVLSESTAEASLDDDERREFWRLFNLHCSDPIVAEYVVEAQGWNRMKLLQIVEAYPLAVHRVFDAAHSALQLGCVSELLSLRQRALAGSLNESFEASR
jgi:hypothetical protein